MMEVIRWSKTNPSLTNIEKNLRDALNDPATLTELCAMVLYQQIISHPYLRQVRGPGTENVNLLDLGPLHKAVCDHIQSILDDPDILFGDELAFETGTLDGQPWHDPLAIEAVIKIMPSLPHLKAVTLAFLRGSLTTWIRFSSEFAPGGLIDECSATEKQLAWMPSTNDANEGALGAYRVAVRGKPSLTLQQYNSQAMYRVKTAKLEALEAALRLYLADPSTFPLPHDPEADREQEALVIETEIVEDWGAEEDIDMEE
ncbi:hypothetical protein B0H12DRAFT_1240213 [Mycena haematopus]|nr:hypothetical protein B0H12DRAFT_1240213 [Mycena haematopus]